MRFLRPWHLPLRGRIHCKRAFSPLPSSRCRLTCFIDSKILDGIGEEGWSSVQIALVQLSSIIYHGLGFIGPEGHGSALWSRTCGR